LDLKSQIAVAHLVGNGLELGPLNNPLPVDEKKASVEYADRLSKTDALRLFPELIDIKDSLVDPDILMDFDTDTLSEIKQRGFDFVIANHVIEHLVNPIQFLKNVSDNLPSGSLFFLTVPDKDFTFDKARALTTNEHLWREYKKGVTNLSNAHIKEFLVNKEVVTEIHPEVKRYFVENGLPLSYYRGNRIPLNPIKRKRLFDFHRSRSIHVHVWNHRSFDNFFNEVNDRENLGFNIIKTHEQDQVHGEMIYLLRRQ